MNKINPTYEDFRREYEYNKRYNFNHHRIFEWDFVLKYLPDLSYIKVNNREKWLNVLDVGCCDSLLIFELLKRNYNTYGLDIRDYDAALPPDIKFFKDDITDSNLINKLYDYKFYYIIALSTIEHIGLNAYGSKHIEDGDRKAIQNIHKLLKDDGYFIMTIPLDYWDSNSGRGYTHKQFLKLINGLFIPIEITHGGGQICTTLIKSQL